MSRWIELEPLIADLDKGLWGKDYDKALAEAIIQDAPSIDLADYVPKNFHDKTCEAMAKRHQEEIADMVGRADADRPQGKWKSVKASIYPYGYDVECSVCGHRMGSSFGYKFCPMCGAQMKGADDE